MRIRPALTVPALAFVLIATACVAGERDTSLSSVEPPPPQAESGDVQQPSATYPRTRARTPDDDWIVTGGLRFAARGIDDESFDAGFSVYVAAWPLQQTHAGPLYQTGLPSTWAESNAGVENAPYSTIEGGLGWWTGTRFPMEAPKFTMGGVSADFYEWANGPGSGGGTAGETDWTEWRWDEPHGKYGVAQLSPYVLFPPDGLNLDPDTDGGLFGYGYHPLPLIEGRTVSGEAGDVDVGDQSWTLFLSTANFRGPVAFFLPDFFAKPLLEDASHFDRFATSPFLDHAGTAPTKPFDVETHDVPAAHATDSDGVSYARVTPFQFPDNGDGNESIVLDRVSIYREAALATQVADWFAGGGPAPTEFRAASTELQRFEDLDVADYFDWVIIPPGVEDGDAEHEIDFSSIVEVVNDGTTFRYRWNLDVVERTNGHFVLPEYYQLVDDPTAESKKSWQPVDANDVPPETGLVEHVFSGLGVRGDTRPFETPTEPDSPWQSPGPTSGPFEVELGDGSVVTYAWYRFIDQPGMRWHDFTDAERDEIQSRVELLHRSWSTDSAYLAPSEVAELASLDEGVLVQPPAGLDIGYVPIVTDQRLADSEEDLSSRSS